MGLRAVAWAWLAHGVLLAVNAAALPLAAEVVMDPSWAESMAMLGASALVEPAQTLMAALATLAWPLAAVGLACIVTAILALRGRTRPLLVVAALHLVLLPLAWWWGTRLLPWGIGDVVGLLVSLALVAWSLRVLRRAVSAPE